MSDKKDKDKGFDREAFKRAIAHVESSGGKYLSNPTSSAAGRYHFLYRYIKNTPILKGVTIREFINRPELQEKIMDMAIDGTLPGYPSYSGYAQELKSKFNLDMDLHEIAALTHFLGKGGAKKYLSNPSGFVVPGKNASVQQYITKFNKAFGPKAPGNKNVIKKISPEEAGHNVKVQDKTAVKQPKESKIIRTDTFQAGSDEYIEYLNSQGVSKEAPEVSEEGEKPGPTVQPETAEPTITDEPINEEAESIARLIPNEPKRMAPVSGELAGKPMEDQLGFMNTLAMGGFAGLNGEKEIIPIENGGTHEQNPYGGVPMGTGSNGKMNTVEEGEVKFGDYIFSNRLALGGFMKSVEDADPNVFATGGDLTDPKEPVGNPITDPIFGPGKELKFTKSEMKPVGLGLKKVSEEFTVPDVREDFMDKNYVSTGPQDTVNFQSAVQDEGGMEFLNRYNDPKTRKLMMEQTGLSSNDIDNMILRGLSPEKVIGGNEPDSKASVNREGNIINVAEKYNNAPGVETHERVHSSMFDAAQGENLLDVLGSPFQQEGKNTFNKFKSYMKLPHEAYGNFSEFREKIGLKPGEQITEKELKKRVKAKGLDDENFYKVFNDKNITKALNTIASTGGQSDDEYRLA